MPRFGISHLRLTSSKGYWPSQAAPGATGERFKSRAFCAREDRLRVQSLQKAVGAAHGSSPISARIARQLARRLNTGRYERSWSISLASSKYMRGVRNRIFSQIAHLVANTRERVTTFTAIKRGWEFTPEQLASVDLEKLLKGFLSDLNRRGAGEAGGWLIAFIHGEFETPAEIYRLHLHGIAAGEMIGVVDRLRVGPKYKFKLDDNVRFRVRIDRKQLTNLPYPLTYCLKSYWPRKHVIIGVNGKRRTRRHGRIPEPHHTQVLTFLDRYSVDDLVVLKHLTVSKGHLKLTCA